MSSSFVFLGPAMFGLALFQVLAVLAPERETTRGDRMQLAYAVLASVSLAVALFGWRLQ